MLLFSRNLGEYHGDEWLIYDLTKITIFVMTFSQSIAIKTSLVGIPNVRF